MSEKEGCERRTGPRTSRPPARREDAHTGATVAPARPRRGPNPVHALEPALAAERGVREYLLRCDRQEHADELEQFLLRLLRRRLRLGGQATPGTLDPGRQCLPLLVPRLGFAATPGYRGGLVRCAALPSGT